MVLFGFYLGIEPIEKNNLENYNKISIIEKDKMSIYRNADIKQKVIALKQYQESGQWLRDFESDERGELPLDLKRGVLSEDGLYNLLIDVEKDNWK